MSALLGLLPPLVLALLFALGCFPGEEIIARIGGRRQRPPVRPASPAPCPVARGAAGIRERLMLLAASRPLRGPPRFSW